MAMAVALPRAAWVSAVAPVQLITPTRKANRRNDGARMVLLMAIGFTLLSVLWKKSS